MGRTKTIVRNISRDVRLDGQRRSLFFNTDIAGMPINSRGDKPSLYLVDRTSEDNEQFYFGFRGNLLMTNFHDISEGEKVDPDTYHDGIVTVKWERIFPGWGEYNSAVPFNERNEEHRRRRAHGYEMAKALLKSVGERPLRAGERVTEVLETLVAYARSYQWI